MSRASGGDFSMGPGLNQPGARRDETAAYRYGHDRPPTPEGMRALTPAEREHNDAWTWSVERGTYVCQHYPAGVE